MSGNGGLTVTEPTAGLARSTAAATALEPGSFAEALTVSRALAESGLFGSSKPEALLVKILTGRELGLTTMQSVRSIYTFEAQGKLIVGLDASLIAACVQRYPGVEEFRCIYTDSNKATYRLKLQGREPVTYTYTIEMARKANLLEKNVWKHHPDAMLRARCVSAMAKMELPAATMGVYSKEELEEIEESSRVAEPVRVTVVSEEPKALQAMCDDLAQYETPPMDTLVAIWNTHKDALHAEAGGDASIIRAAQQEVLRHSAMPITANQFNIACKIGEGAQTYPAFKELRSDLGKAETTSRVVDIWLLHRAAIRELPKYWSDEVAWPMTWARVREIDSSITKPQVWLTNECKKRASTETGAEHVDESEAFERHKNATTQESAPLVAEQKADFARNADDWNDHLAEKRSPHEIANSFLKHQGAFRMVGTLEERRKQTHEALAAAEIDNPTGFIASLEKKSGARR